MSAKTKRIERSQRFKRAWRGENRKSAVSPVVATLILILIAVAAAAALYLWLVVWQGNITGGIGNQHAEPTLQVGGSTSVYPFSSLGATWFEQNNTDVVISDNQGGTGAGMVALCDGNIDLGASSTPQTVSTLESSYGCSSTYASTITITTIAYDAVDVVIAGSNPHGLLSISADTLNGIYESGSAPSSTIHLIGTIDGVAVGTIPAAALPTAGATTPTYAWEDIPALAAGYTIAAGDLWETAAPTQSVGAAADTIVDTHATGAGVPCGYSTTGAAPGTLTDICDAGLFTGTMGGTPCGFEVCAGGTTAYPATATINPVERSDASGTTQTFEAKILGYGAGAGTSTSSWAGSSSGAQTNAGSFAQLGYGGCGSNNLLSDCGFSYGTAQQGNGNAGVAGIISANPNDIGYLSDGIARTTSGIGSAGIVPFLGVGQGIETTGGTPTVGYNGLFSTSSSVYSFGGIIPTTGTSGTIAAGLTSSATVTNYVGGRPFQLISLEPLSGIAQEWVTFLTDPAVNAALASATAEVGLYQVV